ncbi:MAG: hypothetical protein V3T62_11170 [Alphaproteobacteria bacterium]
MAQISKELILAQAREFGGKLPSPERAAELAATLNVLVGALDEASADLSFDAEPANMVRALDELARD